MSHISSFTRRGFLAAGGAATLGALLAACGGDSSQPGSAQEEGSWSFTDDRGQKVSLKARPQRIVAYIGAAAALYDFGVDKQIVGVYGPTKLPDGRPDPQAGELPIAGREIIGNAYGEFNVEKYAGLRPELLIDNMYVKDEFFYVPAESKDKIFALAPQAGIGTGTVPLPKPIQRYADLAAALGADLNAPKVTQAKARFDKAAETLRAAVRDRPGVKVLACSGSADLFYASNPGKNTDLIYFKELGVELVQPEAVGPKGYFEELSWENADKYKADILFLDNRTQTLQPKDLASKPSWRELPAVKAGQIIPWSSEPRFSYAGAAPLLESLANAIRTARKVS